MKVVYIQHTTSMSGAGKALLNIIEQMIEKKVEVHIVLPDNRGMLYNHLSKLDVHCYIFPVTSWVWPATNSLRDWCLFPYRFLRKFRNSLLFYDKLDKLIRELKPEIIHTNVGVIHLGQILARKYSIPHVWHLREYQDLHFNYHAFPSKKHFKKMLSEPNCFPVAITQGVYEHHHLTSNLNAKVIYDGVFKQSKTPEIQLNKENCFLFVGAISEGKGTTELVQSFAKIAKEYPEIELWIAGSGNKSYLDNLKRIINHYSINQQVKFLGHRNDIYQLMSKAKALFVPSRFEGFGFITAEGMYNGCLVVGKNTAGTKEQFDNGLKYTGREIGIRYDDADELTGIMRGIGDERIEKYIETLEIAQQVVSKLYTVERNANELYNFYKNILKKA